MVTETSDADAPKVKTRAFVPGTNVKAKIGKDVSGPFYLVQIVGKTATLQGAQTITVPLSDLRPLD